MTVVRCLVFTGFLTSIINDELPRRVRSAMQFTKSFAVFNLGAALLFAQSTSKPSVEINYPGLNPNRYINITLDGSGRHVFAASDKGTAGEMTGMPLAEFLETAGWGQIPKNDISQYFVRFDGTDTATLPLSEVLRQSMDSRVWLVMEQGGKPLSGAEVPLVVAVAPGGAVTVR